MRLRDLRWYILASIIILISYAGIAFCYYLPVRAKAEDGMKVLGLEATVNTASIAEEKINSVYDTFIIDTNSIEEQPYVAGLASHFFKSGVNPERRIVLKRDKDITGSLKTDYYFFFYKEVDTSINENGFVVGKMLLSDVLKSVETDGVNIYDLYIHEKSGAVYYHNTDNDVALMAQLMGLKSFNLLDEADTYNGVYTIDNQSGVLSGCRFFDIYMSVFIPIDAPYLAIEWVLEQAMAFYIMGVVVVAAMLILLIFGCRKCSKLLRVDRHATEKTKAVVLRIDLDGNIIFTNKTFKQMYGVKRLLNVETIIDVDTQESILKTVKENRAFECSITVDDDVHYLHLSPLKIARSYYLMGTDITIDYLRRKHLFLMNGRNEITNADNSFSLTNNYKHIVSSAELYDIAFIQYNITKYEEIIGVFGRTNFNTLLNEFLASIHETYENLSIYHIDDAKFIVIFPNNSIDEIIPKINESLENLRRPFQIKQNHIYVKCKVIVYNLKKEDADTTELDTIKQKLELAYKNIADFSSKDFIVYEPAMDSAIEYAEEMEKDLVKGLANDEFRMYLQPQYDVISNKIDGFEALIRWMNPKYIEKSPQMFIELAEQRGYMLDIGRYVVKETFRLAKQLEEYGVHISMNVSPIQLLQVGFVQQLCDEFNVLRLKPGSVAIEITETFLMGNFQLMTEKLKLLKEHGFHIHLDDFCTGYSSMLYLKDLPVDTIKIDKEFTKFIETSKVHNSIVKTICNLGTALDLDIICEGVETEAQSDIVKKFGARLIQGYLIGKAVPFDDAVKLLEKYNKKK